MDERGREGGTEDRGRRGEGKREEGRKSKCLAYSPPSFLPSPQLFPNTRKEAQSSDPHQVFALLTDPSMMAEPQQIVAWSRPLLLSVLLFPTSMPLFQILLPPKVSPLHMCVSMPDISSKAQLSDAIPRMSSLNTSPVPLPC